MSHSTIKLLASWQLIPLGSKVFTSIVISISQMEDWVFQEKGKESNQTKLTFCLKNEKVHTSCETSSGTQYYILLQDIKYDCLYSTVNP